MLKTNFKTQNLFSIFLVIILIFPHGLGFRFDLGALDLPRLLLIITALVGGIITFRQIIIKKHIEISKGSIYLMCFTVILILSAVLSSNPTESLKQAIKLLMVWTIFPLAFCKLFGKQNDETLQRYLILILALYIGYCFVEMITQKYFYPAWVRTIFWNIDGYEWINRRVLIRNNALLTQGPFLWNHGMAGMLCALCGLAFRFNNQKNFWGKLLCIGFVIAMASTGVRAALLALTVLIIVRLITHKDLKLLISFTIGLFLSNLFYIFRIKGLAPQFYTHDLTEPWTQNKYSSETGAQAISDLLGVNYNKSLIFLEAMGALGSKFSGLVVNLTRIKEWALHGYGFGSYQHPELVPSNAYQYDDPGLMMLFFFENGIFAGMLLVYFLGSAFLLGLKHPKLIWYSYGILCWSIFSLSSWEVWPLLLVNIFALRIFWFNQKTS